MATIWKFPFEISDKITVEMPAGAKILHVEVQNGVPCIWAHVHPVQEKRKYAFRIVGTGHEHNDLHAEDHIASFQNGPFVWHLFRGH